MGEAKRNPVPRGICKACKKRRHIAPPEIMFRCGSGVFITIGETCRECRLRDRKFVMFLMGITS